MLDKLALFAVAPLTFAGSLVGLDASAREEQRSYGAAAIAGNGGMRIARAADGLFYIPVRIGNRTLDMALDTGATRSVIPSNLAFSHKIRVQNGGGTIETLDGQVRFNRATIQDVTVSSTHFAQIEVAIADIDFPAPLLGQDLLRELGPVTIDGDTLTLR